MNAHHTALALAIEPDTGDTKAAAVPASLLGDLLRARQHAEHARAESTRRGYESDLELFSAYCAERDVPAIPASPQTVAAYVAHRAEAGVALATVRRSIVAIAQAHKRLGLDNPCAHGALRDVIKGVARDLGATVTRKAAATSEIVIAMTSTLDASTLRGLRDRAMLLLGFAGGFRRSELVALTVNDLSWRDEGLIIQLRRSKTDQTSVGRPVGVPYTFTQHCAAQALRAWLAAAGIATGPLFRGIDRHGNMSAEAVSDKQVARLVKAAAQAAGLDAARFSGHSLRAGLVTSAARAGKTAQQIALTTGHSSPRMIQVYIREAEVLGAANVVRGIGL